MKIKVPVLNFLSNTMTHCRLKKNGPGLGRSTLKYTHPLPIPKGHGPTCHDDFTQLLAHIFTNDRDLRDEIMLAFIGAETSLLYIGIVGVATTTYIPSTFLQARDTALTIACLLSSCTALAKNLSSNLTFIIYLAQFISSLNWGGGRSDNA